MKVVVLDVRRGGGVEEKRRRTKGVKNGGERERPLSSMKENKTVMESPGVKTVI
jgi:hypothetical protein